MPAFSYTALNPAGQQVSGRLQVGTRAEVYRQLESQSLTPVKVNEESAAASAKAKVADKNEPILLKRAQIIMFTEELADLLDGGLQIDQALRVLEERQEAIALRRMSGILRNEVREGSTISKALRKASPSFDELYINMVSAGEASGSLPQILRRLAMGLNVIADLQNKVTQAMIYPAILVLACIALLVVFVTVLVPQLKELLSNNTASLPVATRMLLATTAFVTQWWWAILGAVIIIALGFRGYINSPGGKLWWHQNQMKIPAFGPVVSMRAYAQLAHSLGNLVNNGVPLLNSLKLCTKATANLFLQGLLSKAVALVAEGASLSGSLKNVGHFPMLLVDMIAIGEQTGAIGKSLEKTAARYDKELDKRIKRMTALISPAIMIFMAVVVGLVAYSIVTAIFSSTQSVRANM